jgi:hypothetical protein
MSDDTLTTCPKCEGELRKIFAPPAIAFKGSGFYTTDHGKNSKPSEGSSEKKPDGGDAKETKDTKGAKSDTSTSGSKDGSSSDTSSAPAKKEATPS